VNRVRFSLSLAHGDHVIKRGMKAGD